MPKIWATYFIEFGFETVRLVLSSFLQIFDKKCYFSCLLCFHFFAKSSYAFGLETVIELQTNLVLKASVNIQLISK